MIKRMVFVRGLPGSGKSTIAKAYKEKHIRPKDSCWVCATDNYWMRPDGKYDFNYDLLGWSHIWNQRRVEEILNTEVNSEWDTIVVVDNTNINFSEMKPYIRLGLLYKYDIVFSEPDTEWKYNVEECYKRNTHGVPYSTMLRMYKAWQDHRTVKAYLEEMIHVQNNM